MALSADALSGCAPGEVLITARKRAERRQDVTMSYTAAKLSSVFSAGGTVSYGRLDELADLLEFANAETVTVNNQPAVPG